MSLLSATAIKDFKACPQRFRLRYVELLRRKETTDALRMGTNWGELHGIWNHPSLPPVEEGEGERDLHVESAVEHLNKRYASMPNGVEPDDWEVEKLMLLTCLIGYYEYWEDDPIQVEISEQRFDLRVGRHNLMGKIDHKAVWQGQPTIVERKSTSRSLEPDSPYWGTWQRDLQISLYALASPPDTRILLDVWRKPTIKQKKTETPQQYAERLAGDIAERPTHYFARRELSRTEKDLARFRKQLAAVERNIGYAEQTGNWVENESACHDPWPCDYRSICYGPGADAIAADKSTPDGFVRLTVKGS